MRNVRVFISSPGDVAAERAEAREILESLPRTPFLRGRVSLELIAWDDPAAPAPMLANLSPQDAVNRGLPKPSECDLTIVILWSRMGTPLAQPLKKDGTPYLSGTEWEYQDAIDAGKDVLLYRRTTKAQVDLDDPRLDDKRQQQRLVAEFFSRFTDPQGRLTHSLTSYETVEQFKERLRQDLDSLLARMLEAAAPEPQPAGPAVVPAPATPQPPPVDDTAVVAWPVHAFLTVTAPSADLPLLTVGCVLVEDVDGARRLMTGTMDDLQSDPQLRNIPSVTALRRKGADYWSDDPEVRGRIIEALLAIPFEAFVWFARSGGNADASLRQTVQGLLRDRLAAERTRSVAIAVDSRNAGNVEDVGQAVAEAVRDIKASDKRSVVEPTIAVAQTSEVMITIARYAAAIVARRVHEPGDLEKRAFERLHPSKIRVVHEMGTRNFYDRRKPLR